MALFAFSKDRQLYINSTQAINISFTQLVAETNYRICSKLRESFLGQKPLKLTFTKVIMVFDSIKLAYQKRQPHAKYD